MEKYKVIIKNSAKKDLKIIKQNHLKEQFLSIVQTLQRNPYDTSQGFEKLLPREKGIYSRRINIQHRVVYKIDEDKKIVEIYSAWSHYE